MGEIEERKRDAGSKKSDKGIKIASPFHQPILNVCKKGVIMFFIFKAVFKWIFEKFSLIICMIFIWYSFWAGYNNYDKTIGIVKNIIGQFRAVPVAYREFFEECSVIIEEDNIIIKTALEEKVKFFMNKKLF